MDVKPELPQAGPLLTPREVAGLFRVSGSSVRKWESQGKLFSIRTPGGHRRYPARQEGLAGFVPGAELEGTP